MAKVTAWLVTLIGVLLILPLIGITALKPINDWVIALSILVVGIGKLVRNYQKKKK